jgi:hypothetical protein
VGEVVQQVRISVGPPAGSSRNIPLRKMTAAEREAVAFAVLTTFNGSGASVLKGALGMSGHEVRELHERVTAAQRRAEQSEHALTKVIKRSRDGGTGSDSEQPAGKRCPRCCRVLPRDRFSLNKGMADGLRVYCRSCMSSWLKAYRDGKPGQRQAEREWQRSHRAKLKVAREAS